MKRPFFTHQILSAFATHPVVALLGPRQCGKTTLSRLYIQEDHLEKTSHFFDLEDPTDLAILENPKTALAPLEGLIVLDEIQRMPNLFPLLRVLVDQPDSRQRFLILGSASRELIRQSSETLAGRIASIELTPFSIQEVDYSEELWMRGGFPNSYLASSAEASFYWRKQYISTFLERDIPNLGLRIAPVALRRFWLMLTHCHGQAFNASELGRSLGIADTTVRHYLDILTGTFMIRQLLPWYENLSKRQVKKPKIYFRDSGIYHALCEIPDKKTLLHHPKLGASWEGFAVEEVIRLYGAAPEECFYWGIHGQSELDLFMIKEGKRLGFEFKYCDAPKLTPSMKMALELLHLDSLTVIYPGDKDYVLAPNVQVKALRLLHSNSRPVK
ncbi:MAG: ATP-binding protein [Verrucomicrobia bacterium]|nr:ATP-binding protein [Verrucomicrobiota bacterium]